MKAKIEFDDNLFIKHLVTDANGEYELPDNFDFDFVYCYRLVGNEFVLDADKRAEQIAEEKKAEELAELQMKLNESDYIISRTFEEIMALDSSVTFIADFIKILKQFRTQYSEILANRKSWRQRIEELRG